MPMLTMVVSRLPVCPVHSPERTFAREGGHAVEDLVDVGDDVLAVDHERRVARGAQGGVQDGAVLGDVDVLAAEHRLDALGQAGGAGPGPPAGPASRP